MARSSKPAASAAGLITLNAPGSETPAAEPAQPLNRGALAGNGRAFAPVSAEAPAAGSPGETEPRTEPDRFDRVPIERIYESKTNPRRSFDEKAMAELVESVRAHGILVPLTLRSKPVEATDLLYEIVAGTRRFRAARAAGLSLVPAIIKCLSDRAALEIQLVDNLQREDLSPLEEAQQYRVLLKDLGYSIEKLQQKIGKSVAHIYARLKLLDLAAPAQAAFLAGALPPAAEGGEPIPFTAGHAVLIARLQPAEQARAMEQLARGWVRSVRELARWISQNIHLALEAAPFEQADAQLLPAAGACTVCPKRTGTNPEAFAEEKNPNVCTDPTCYRRKIGALCDRLAAAAEAAGKPLVKVSTGYAAPEQPGVLPRSKYLIIGEKGRERCPAARPALIVEGDGTGKILPAVCADPACKTHFAKPASTVSVFTKTAGAATAKPAAPAADAKDAEQREKREQAEAERLKAERERLQDAERKRAAFETRVLAAIAATVPAGRLARRDVELVSSALFLAASYEDVEKTARDLGIALPQSTRGTLLERVLALPNGRLNHALVALAARVQHDWKKIARERKIDLAAIERKIEAEFAATAKRPQPKASASGNLLRRGRTGAVRALVSVACRSVRGITHAGYYATGRERARPPSSAAAGCSLKAR